MYVHASYVIGLHNIRILKPQRDDFVKLAQIMFHIKNPWTAVCTGGFNIIILVSSFNSRFNFAFTKYRTRLFKSCTAAAAHRDYIDKKFDRN